MKKILVATQKPFAAAAKKEIENIFKNDSYQLSFLEKYQDACALKDAVKDAQALIVRSDKVTADIVDAAAQLRIVVRAGAGYDNLDLEAMSAKGVVAMNTPGQNANSVAELALGMLIFMSRNRFCPGTGIELGGKVLGLHGFGAVARLLGQKASALGMEVCAFDPFVKDEDMLSQGVTPIKTLPELYARSFAVSIHVPALPSTVGSVNLELLSNMSASSRCIVLNTARAEVVDADGMFEALAKNPKLCYATDVSSSSDPSWARFEQAYGTRVWANQGKIGAQTEEANTRAAAAAASQIVDFFENGVTKFQLNR